MILLEWADASQRQYRAATESFTSAPDCAIAPNVHYAARIIKPGGVQRSLWKPGSANGSRTTASIGSVVLANADGGLDGLLDQAFDGRPLRILEGTGKRRDQFATLLAGTLAGVVVSGSEVTLRVRDRVEQIASEIAQPIRYAGDNVLPAGAEGTAADLKGKPKPWLVGDCENFNPPCVNTSRLIYQISCKAIAEVVAVSSNGAAITVGTVRTDLAALQATAPSAGTYDFSLGNDATGEGAYFRLGSSPANATITCHAREGANAAARTPAQVARRLMLVAPGVTESEVPTAGFLAMDAFQSDACGWWFAPEDGQTLGPAIDAVLASAGAGWTPRRNGTFAPLRLDDPTGYEPVASFGDGDILPGLRCYAAGSDNANPPPYEVALSWGRNWTVQSAQQTAGSITDARRTFLALAYRTATVRDSRIWEPVSRSGRNPLSQPLTHTTQLRTEANAQAEADRLLRLFGTSRRIVDMVLPRSRVPASLDLGAVIRLTHPRFGLAAGKQFAVTAMDEDWTASTVRIEGWG
jgi:hypothetical protein